MTQLAPEILRINDRIIRTDAEGRFCLNDFHKEAGGRSKHQPYHWAHLDATKELIDALGNPGFPGFSSEQNQSSEMRIAPLSIVRGVKGGTFAVKELVYDYAMWISPEFKLIVIRVFDQLAQCGVLANGMPDLFGGAPLIDRKPFKPAHYGQHALPAPSTSLDLASDMLRALLATGATVPSDLVSRYLDLKGA